MDVADFAKTLSLGDVRRLRRYENGLHNDTYELLTSKGHYSLRVYNYKKPRQISFELAMLDRLGDLPVPHPLLVRGQPLTKFEGKYALLYEYLPGVHLTRFTPVQLREIGGFLAEFHLRERRFSWKGRRYQFYNLPDDKIARFARVAREKRISHLKKLPAIIAELRSCRLERGLPRGPIHVDVKPENVLFNNGRLSGVLDFDNAFVGPLILDLAKSMVWFGTRNKGFHLDDALEVYHGYIERRPLGAAEKAAMHSAVRFAFLSHIFVDYYMYAIGATSKAYFDFIVNELYAAYKTFRISEAEFDVLLH